MKPIEENGNPFLKQMSKLFEDLAAAKEKPPISPRITCTRLRRLREIRCELVETSDPSLSIISQHELEATVEQLNAARTKNESFASWVLRNRAAHQELADKQNQLRGQISSPKYENRRSSNSNAFSNFSPTALQRVAKNPNTPPSTLKWLAAHYRADVRQVMASNPNIGEEINTILAGDADEGVRLILAGNKALSRDLLLKLCDDPSPLVSENAKNILYAKSSSPILDNNNSVTGGSAISSDSVSKKNKVAKPNNFSQKFSENVIAKSLVCSNDNDKNKKESEIIEKEFLQVIAERATTPPRRLAELALHSDKLIRCLVAANPNATPEILWLLAKDESIDVRRKLLSNYNCPEEIINYLMRK